MISHGGDIFRIAEHLSIDPLDLTDFSASINPLGFPPWLREEISRNVSLLAVYPDIGQKEFIKAAAEYSGAEENMILPGNGAGELIHLISGVLNPERVIIPVPSYGEYERSCRNFQKKYLPLLESEGFTLNPAVLEKMLSGIEGKRQLVFIGQPNNPTGTITDPDKIISLAGEFPKAWFCIDESFAEFAPEYSFPVNKLGGNIILIRSMTKFYAIPGLRLGYCVADPSIVERLKENIPPWSVNTLALAAGTRMLGDSKYRKNSVTTVKKLRKALEENLGLFPWIRVFPTEANYILLKITDKRVKTEKLQVFLLEKRILIRSCTGFRGLSGSFLRIAVKQRNENNALLSAFADFGALAGITDKNVFFQTPKEGGSTGAAVKQSPKKTPALMIQGTASNAGKSILAAGLCRILHRKGIKTAPFKAQNMSLNSAVTPDGLEIGRAQALQAAAAGILPDVRMNPLLLKPAAGRGSDVILSGRSAGYISAASWFELKEKARQTIRESYDSLSSEYDVIILEGAGSSGEINLKEGDLVNMAMARYAGAGVLIAGDIDRGGVYASLTGLMEVFEEWERDLVKGFIINKFRGNGDLLKRAHSMIAYRTGKHVIGVVPYFREIHLPEEDSVSFKEQASGGTGRLAGESQETISIGIIDLPSISNFTDFDPLKLEKDVNVTVIRRNEGNLHSLDAVIIPGSKMVEEDLEYLKRSGLAEMLIREAEEDSTVIIGICGGFQILGKTISDPQSIESKSRIIKGLGLLGIETRFHSNKRLANVEVRHHPSNLMVTGYEIHHGRSEFLSGKIILGSREDLLGVSTDNGNIWGTYLHGIFNNDDFRRWFLNGIRKQKGVASGPDMFSFDIDSNLDKLANLLTESLDMDFIYKLLGIR